MAAISIIFLTNRVDPKFDWFIESLCNQTNEQERSNIELVFVDYLANERIIHHPKLKEFSAVIHSTIKPSLYQGKHRKTKREFFSAAAARNTGVILSSGNYLVFVDDVSVLMPSWWGAVWQGFVNNRILCGAYQKHFDMVVENGTLVSSRAHDAGKDSRWEKGSDHGPVQISGNSLFGSSLGIPASDILDVNGFDEICDSIGGEDYHFGIRLNNAGKKIWYDRKMFTIESEELHNQLHQMHREDRKLEPINYMARLKELGIDRRAIPNGNWDSSHMILDILLRKRQTRSYYNKYDLRKCREEKIFEPVAEETEHWFDKHKLSEL